MLESLPPALRLPLLLVLLVVGVHRATRIVTRDKLPLICIPREKFVYRWGAYEDEPSDDWEARRRKRKVSLGGKQTNAFMASLAYLWECDWCASIWIGAAAAYLTWRWPDEMLWVLAALTASTITGLLVKLETYVDKKTEKLR